MKLDTFESIPVWASLRYRYRLVPLSRMEVVALPVYSVLPLRSNLVAFTVVATLPDMPINLNTPVETWPEITT